MQAMQVFILAGGFATRLWPLTEKRAKPLLPVAGKPILSYTVEAVPEELPITVSTNAVFADDFYAWKKTLKNQNVTISIEDAGHEGEKFGALGAVAHWIHEKNITEDVLLLAGDNYAAADLSAFIAKFKGNPLIAGHDIGDTERARQFGTIVLKEEPPSLQSTSTVLSFEEKPEHPKSTIVSTGWWIIPASALPVLTEHAKLHPDNIGSVFEEFLRRNITIDCFVFESLWKDIGSFEAYMSLHRELVGEKTMIDASTNVQENCTCTGSVTIGKKCVVSASSLQDCMIFEGCSIKNCVLNRCVIDEHCTLEGVDLTDKMIRAGTILQLKH